MPLREGVQFTEKSAAWETLLFSRSHDQLLRQSQTMIYLQITSGRGPAECELAVSHIVHRMMDGRSSPFLDLIQVGTGSAIVSVAGSMAREYADSWIGTILWVCQDPITSNRKRKNWYVGIREVELPDEELAALNDRDLEWQTMKSSGKGGQHANKNDTAVRLKHKPTGITVIAQDERSQKRNKALAIGRLECALRQRRADAIRALEQSNWNQHNELERGNPVRIFEGPDFVARH